MPVAPVRDVPLCETVVILPPGELPEGMGKRRRFHYCSPRPFDSDGEKLVTKDFTQYVTTKRAAEIVQGVPAESGVRVPPKDQ